MNLRIIKAVGLSPRHVLTPGAIVSVPAEVPEEIARKWINAGIAAEDLTKLATATGIYQPEPEDEEDDQ